MSILCGHCKHHHESVAQVRACASGHSHARTATMPKGIVVSADPASPRQLETILSMAENREVPVAGKSTDEARNIATIENAQGGKGVTRQEASSAISYLYSLPRAGRVVERVEMPKVHSGHYALRLDNVVKFFKVDTPTEGRWAGYTFVKIQASDEYYPVKGDLKKQVLELIAKDQQGAMLLYGQEIGRCGHCNRTLTNEESRARGIGPICAGKMGW